LTKTLSKADVILVGHARGDIGGGLKIALLFWAIRPLKTHEMYMCGNDRSNISLFVCTLPVWLIVLVVVLLLR
jgi:hypothetical protein